VNIQRSGNWQLGFLVWPCARCKNEPTSECIVPAEKASIELVYSLLFPSFSSLDLRIQQSCGFLRESVKGFEESEASIMMILNYTFIVHVNCQVLPINVYLNTSLYDPSFSYVGLPRLPEFYIFQLPRTIPIGDPFVNFQTLFLPGDI